MNANEAEIIIYNSQPMPKTFFFILTTGIYWHVFRHITRIPASVFGSGGFVQLMACVAVLFGLYVWASRQNWRLNLYFWVIYTAAHLPIFFYLPNLSDDFYRFYLDGLLGAQGINPYEYTPKNLPQNIIQNIDFQYINLLNSPNYYSVYPPINQVFFAIAAFFFKGSVLGFVNVIRVFLLGFNILSGIFIQKITGDKRAFLYLFNPLLMVETVGNLHFEGAYICLVLMAFYYFFETKKNRFAAIFLALGAGIKLIPLMFLPFFIWQKNTLQWRFLTVFSMVFLMIFGLLSIQNLQNILQSTRLYYGSFEFNASVYYALRWVGYEFVGYNIIQVLMPFLGILVLFFVVFQVFFNVQKPYFNRAWWCFFVYLLLAAVVHQWYALPLLALGLCGGVVVPSVVLSGVVFLGYSAYNSVDYHENYWLICIEYGLFFASIGYYFFIKKSTDENHELIKS